MRPLTTRLALSCLTILLAVCAPRFALAATVPAGFADQLVRGSLAEVVGLAEVPDPVADSTRRVLFVEQRTARVGLVVGGATFTVGTVPGVSAVDGERGLLGVAVDPGFPARPYLYVHCTDGRSGNTIAISRFTLTGDLAYASDGHLAFDAATRYDLRANLPDAASNHNGGTVRFGTDGKLYVSLGDDATGCPAQDSTRLAGKILRLDTSRLPAGSGGPAPFALLAAAGNPYASSPDSSARLVWAIGLRNPFRFNVDSGTGALFVGDVGQNLWEELDLVDAGGRDLGWPLREGPAAYSTCAGGAARPLTAPIAYYDHSFGQVIIPGPVYRSHTGGTRNFPAEYEGNAFYLDYYDGEMWRITGSGSTWLPAAPVAGQPTVDYWGTGFATTSDMIELSDGSIWYCVQFASGTGVGEIHRIVVTTTTSVPPQAPDRFVLSAPSPNPVRDRTAIRWTQPVADAARVTVHDAAGRRVRTIDVPEATAIGPHSVYWDGHDDGGRRVSPGLYLVRVRLGDTTRSTRLMLVH